VGMPIPAGAACIASVILLWPTPLQTTSHAYLFAMEIFVVGLLMVSTLRFPSFKKPPNSPGGRLWRTVTFVGMMSLLLIFQAKFLVSFFATYTLASLLVNLGWRLGWRGILPPLTHSLPAVKEPIDTIH